MSPSLPKTHLDMPIAAVLAGGRGTRLGGADKGLLALRGNYLIDKVLSALEHQVAGRIIVANRHASEYAARGLPVLADAWPGQVGPLAGIYTALQHVASGDVLVVPVDAPQLPPDLVDRLQGARLQQGKPAACVRDAHGIQPLCCLLPAAWAPSARDALSAGLYSVQRWLMSQDVAMADFGAWPAHAWSVNTPEEWAALEQAI